MAVGYHLPILGWGRSWAWLPEQCGCRVCTSFDLHRSLAERVHFGNLSLLSREQEFIHFSGFFLSSQLFLHQLELLQFNSEFTNSNQHNPLCSSLVLFHYILKRKFQVTGFVLFLVVIPVNSRLAERERRNSANFFFLHIYVIKFLRSKKFKIFFSQIFS